MADDRKSQEIPERKTEATTRPTTMPLNEFVLKPELYCHRDDKELKDRESLKPLMDSLIVEGLQTPVEFLPKGTECCRRRQRPAGCGP